MFDKWKDKIGPLGLIFTIAAAIITMVLSDNLFFTDPRLEPWRFDAGVDSLGALICAALFYGSMRQKGAGAREFRVLVVLESASFMVNVLIYLTLGVPEQSAFTFASVMVSKLVDLVIIFFFYQYVSKTLGFEGKAAALTAKCIPVLMVLQALVQLSNTIRPVTFFINDAGSYQATGFSWAEDIYLVLATLAAIVLILRCESPRNQKAAALTFIFLPLFIYIALGGTFGNAAQYGMALMSLIIMYCIIFNYNSSKLAVTSSELNMAAEIQTSMIPSIFPMFPERKEFDLYASMDPAREVGGDFYDFFLIDDDHLGIVIADVSGKGVPAALFMMISKTIIKNFAMLGISASEIMDKSNKALCEQNTTGMFVTVWIGILEISTGKMTCSNAGHEYPAICHNGAFKLLKDKHGLVLGAMDLSVYKEYEIQLDKGDKIFVYTDGVPEATNAEDIQFGTDRTEAALNIKAEADPKEILKIVRASVDEFVGNAEQYDDLTMVCLEYKGVPDQGEDAAE